MGSYNPSQKDRELILNRISERLNNGKDWRTY